MCLGQPGRARGTHRGPESRRGRPTGAGSSGRTVAGGGAGEAAGDRSGRGRRVRGPRPGLGGLAAVGWGDACRGCQVSRAVTQRPGGRDRWPAVQDRTGRRPPWARTGVRSLSAWARRCPQQRCLFLPERGGPRHPPCPRGLSSGASGSRGCPPAPAFASVSARSPPSLAHVCDFRATGRVSLVLNVPVLLRP